MWRQFCFHASKVTEASEIATVLDEKFGTMVGQYFLELTDFGAAYMALACEICGKKPHYGNTISHAHNVTRRRWNPNLRRVRAVVDGVRKQVRVCTACIKAGRVKKAA